MTTLQHVATVAGIVVAGFVALFGMLWAFGLVAHVLITGRF